MIIKAYIRNHLFHLPRKQDDLTEQIKEKFYSRKKLIKSSIAKMYPISKIETKDDKIKIEHSRDLNIFLLNIYLLFIENKGIDQLSKIEIKLTNENIKQELSKEIEEIGKNTEIEEVEKHVFNHIRNKDIVKKSTKNKDIFNMDWVIQMDKKLREG